MLIPNMFNAGMMSVVFLLSLNIIYFYIYLMAVILFHIYIAYNLTNSQKSISLECIYFSTTNIYIYLY